MGGSRQKKRSAADQALWDRAMREAGGLDTPKVSSGSSLLGGLGGVQEAMLDSSTALVRKRYKELKEVASLKALEAPDLTDEAIRASQAAERERLQMGTNRRSLFGKPTGYRSLLGGKR